MALVLVLNTGTVENLLAVHLSVLTGILWAVSGGLHACYFCCAAGDLYFYDLSHFNFLVHHMSLKLFIGTGWFLVHL